DRPELLRRTVRSIVAQDHDGGIETIVVYDGTQPDPTLVGLGTARRPVRVVVNDRTPGLAGARNTGVMAADTEFVAFCDDDDRWCPQKVGRQVARASAGDRPALVTCAITVDYEGRFSDRLAGTDRVVHARLTRSRMAMLHSSTFLFRRDALVHEIGLVSERIPGSQNEDWDLLLRTAERGPIAHLEQPLVVVQWGRTSLFARSWDTKVASLHWMLEQHPAIGRDRRGVARVHGQIAFGEAAQGHARVALRWVGRTLREDPTQWRALVALPVAGHLVRAESVLDVLHRFGRGV
ncbi:MAG: glycosyltransferase, partial [Nocardiaceae bacterium]|nr:glycosyltransferase [Nocardiaceae bacterium]